MSNCLILHSCGPALSIQDTGRSGYLAQGLTRGGAADQLALYEGAALLRQSADLAAIEMVGAGGVFEVTQDTAIALTGAEMSVSIDGTTLAWNASHMLPAGARLTIGGVRSGNYGYLHLAGGIDIAPQMGARSSHLSAGIGALLKSGARLPVGRATNPRTGQYFVPDNRLGGGVVRIVPSMQTEQFSDTERDRFTATIFRRDARANRMGVRMDHDGPGFSAADTLNIVSEVIVPGDIQITGDGAPFVLMSESQTTGGYPRIATVIPSDLPRVAQAQAGTPMRFEFVTLDQAREIETRARAENRSLSNRFHQLIRDPHDIPDLLGYQLVSGAVSASDDPFQT